MTNDYEVENRSLSSFLLAVIQTERVSDDVTRKIGPLDFTTHIFPPKLSEYKDFNITLIVDRVKGDFSKVI